MPWQWKCCPQLSASSPNSSTGQNDLLVNSLVALVPAPSLQCTRSKPPAPQLCVASLAPTSSPNASHETPLTGWGTEPRSPVLLRITPQDRGLRHRSKGSAENGLSGPRPKGALQRLLTGTLSLVACPQKCRAVQGQSQRPAIVSGQGSEPTKGPDIALHIPSTVS
jgi:hypothetical protein